VVTGKLVNRFPTSNRFSERLAGYQIFCLRVYGDDNVVTVFSLNLVFVFLYTSILAR